MSAHEPVDEKTGARARTDQVGAVESRQILTAVAEGASIEEICRRFKRARNTVKRVIERAGAARGKEADPEAVRRAAAAAAASKEAVERAALNIERIRQVKDDHFKLTQLIPKVQGKLLAQALKDGRPPAALEKDMRALKQMMETIKIAREESYILLQVEKHEANEEQESLPILEIRELTVGEIREMVQASRVTDGDALDGLTEAGRRELEATLADPGAPLDFDDIVIEGDDDEDDDSEGRTEPARGSL